jgi:hypothetical protein
VQKQVEVISLRLKTLDDELCNLSAIPRDRQQLNTQMKFVQVPLWIVHETTTFGFFFVQAVQYKFHKRQNVYSLV